MNIVTNPPAQAVSNEVRLPSADIHETPELIRIRFNVPGAGPEDLEVTYENKTLAIQSKRKESQAAPIYQRSIGIPRDLDPAAIRATLRDGVLDIELPKAKAPGAVTIPIAS
jgi:HSP20 family protein